MRKFESQGLPGSGKKHQLSSAIVQAGMAEEPAGNSAGGKAFGQWLYRRRKGVEEWMKDKSSAWFGKAGDRYEKLRQKSFLEVEAAELIHSLSFQKELESTGADSKRGQQHINVLLLLLLLLESKQRYDRFAAIAPCKTMDPEMEFELKYEAVDDALQMARKAQNKFEKSIFEGSSFTVKLMGIGVLQMKSAKNAWVVVRVDFSSFDSCALRVNPGTGNETKNPVYETFTSISGCRSIEKAETLDGFPKQIKSKLDGKNFRGLLLGSGLPDEILFEVLVDPEDFLQEVPLE
eukprot:Skav212894  [mRNA]  locus=scaffold374:17109:20829:+ [translate_table: standard]